MKLLSSFNLENFDFNCSRFKMIRDMFIDKLDSKNKTILMYICSN